MSTKRSSAFAKRPIPVFFAAQNNTLPYIAVALQSLLEHASRAYCYAVHIVHNGIDRDDARRVLSLAAENVTIEFTQIAAPVDACRLHIAALFTQYDKALYLDGDVVVNGDVSNLYRLDLGNNLLGAVTDETVLAHPLLSDYVQTTLGIAPQNYFNAGVLLMNLHAIREENILARCEELKSRYRFSIAPEQDCLNVVCRNRVRYFSPDWNKMPLDEESATPPKLIHYCLSHKPWHYDGVPYSGYFWRCAHRNPFLGEILNERIHFVPEYPQSDPPPVSLFPIATAAL